MGANIAQAWPVVFARIVAFIELEQVPLGQTVIGRRPTGAPGPRCDSGIEIPIAVLDHAATAMLTRCHERPDMNCVEAGRGTIVDPTPVVNVQVLHYAVCAAVANQDEKMKFEIEHIQSGEIQLLETPEAFLEFITSFTNQPEAND